MSNMSYCRFRNTLSDLRDCANNFMDDDLSVEEHNARSLLIIEMANIFDEIGVELVREDIDETLIKRKEIQ